jgi:hypothetical protein
MAALSSQDGELLSARRCPQLDESLLLVQQRANVLSRIDCTQLHFDSCAQVRRLDVHAAESTVVHGFHCASNNFFRASDGRRCIKLRQEAGLCALALIVVSLDRGTWWSFQSP